MLKKINEKISNSNIKESSIAKNIVNGKTVNNIDNTKLLIFGVWFLLTTLLVAIPFFSNKVNLKIDDVAPYSVFSPVNIEFETSQNREKTEELRESRAELEVDVHSIDNNLTEKVKNKIASFFTKISQLRKLEADAPERAEIKNNLEFQLSQKDLVTLISADQTILILIEDYILRTIDKLMAEGVENVNSNETKSRIIHDVSKININIKYKRVIQEVISKSVVNNKTFDLVATNQQRSEARASVNPIKTRLRKNQPLFYKGDKITEEHVEILKILGLYGSIFNIFTIMAIAVINFVMFFLLINYLIYNKHNILKNNNHLVLIATVSTLTVLIARILTNSNPYYLPIVAAAMLLAITLTDQVLAAILIVWSSVLSAIIFNFDFNLLIIWLLTGLAAIYFSKNITDRTDITKAGFQVALASLVILLSVQVASSNFVYTVLFSAAIRLLAIALISAVFVLGILPYVESLFNLVTSIKLLELSNPNNILLKRLLIEAPGSYHHSIMVANLAEAAIEATKGDPLLARVAAYYHDIGKIKRPSFFIENQTGLGNPHDKINPKLSSLIILSHVKDGVDLAKKHQLPQSIIDIVEQHHGRGLISFFYREFLKAKEETEEHKEVSIDDEEFRYPGPKPKSSEAAVIMLADACEAAIRSLEKPTPTKVENLIEKILKEKFNDGQLDESDFTFQDLTKIKKAFLKRLEGMFHARIEYPDTDKGDGQDLPKEREINDLPK